MAERRIVRTRGADDGRIVRTPGKDADERPARRRARPSDDEKLDGRPRKDRTRKAESGITAAQAAQAALRQIAELTGKEPEGVTGVEPTEDGWVVGVEIVEDRRIPSSTDLLATYEAELDPGGDLVSYRRVKRYTRGAGDNGDS